jgi:hypothetical protein
MDGFVIKPRRETGITDEQLFVLYKDAYSQWSEAGIESSWCGFTQEDFEHLSRYAAKAAINAAWSVNWHLKNGYRIVGYMRSETDNHPSYVFRLQLQPSIFWSGPLAPITARICYFCSYMVTCLVKDPTRTVKHIWSSCFLFLSQKIKIWLNLFGLCFSTLSIS